MSLITVSPRRALIALAAALVAIGLLSAVPSAHAVTTQYDRHITHDAGSKMTITDDESWPFSDEVGSFVLDETKFPGPVVSPIGPHPIQTISKCVGGEVRVELTIEYGHVTFFPTHIIATVTAKLYEGTSCSTTDLDGTKKVDIYIAPNTSASSTFTVNNDAEGGDKATITLNMTNRPV